MQGLIEAVWTIQRKMYSSFTGYLDFIWFFFAVSISWRRNHGAISRWRGEWSCIYLFDEVKNHSGVNPLSSISFMPSYFGFLYSDNLYWHFSLSLLFSLYMITGLQYVFQTLEFLLPLLDCTAFFRSFFPTVTLINTTDHDKLSRYQINGKSYWTRKESRGFNFLNINIVYENVSSFWPIFEYKFLTHQIRNQRLLVAILHVNLVNNQKWNFMTTESPRKNYRVTKNDRDSIKWSRTILSWRLHYGATHKLQILLSSLRKIKDPLLA